MYQIIDIKTGQVVATAKTLKSACRMVDKRDLAYGACRYTKRKVYA